MTDTPNRRGPLGEAPVAEFLRILRREFVESLATGFDPGRAQVMVGMSVPLLDYLIVREDGVDAALDARSASVARAVAALGGGDATLESLEQLASRTVAQAREEGTQGPDQAVLREFLADERAFLASLEGTPPAPAVTDDPAASEGLVEKLTDYLRSRQEGADVRVSGLGNPLGGFSKDVFVAELAGADRPADRAVVRRDRPVGPLETSVQAEYEVLRAADAAGVPVARPLHLESDPGVLGTPFLILEFVEGSPGGDHLRNVQGDVDTASTFRRLAELVGTVHTIELEAAGVPASEAKRSVNEHILELFDAFEDQWRRRRSVPSPTLAAAFTWLRENLPEGGGDPVVVHADPTPRNLLMRDGEIVAMLDWETWHVGDPAEDLAYCKDEIGDQWDWDEFLAVYRATSGRDVDPARIEYWMLWKYVFGAVSGISLLEHVTPETDLRSAFAAVYYTRFCEARVAEQLSALI